MHFNMFFNMLSPLCRFNYTFISPQGEPAGDKEKIAAKEARAINASPRFAGVRGGSSSSTQTDRRVFMEQLPPTKIRPPIIFIEKKKKSDSLLGKKGTIRLCFSAS